jgi:2-oxoglutarate dehydrogenase E2 component (dihydrolipoamide succinyltransferase)
MTRKITVPQLGESVVEATVGQWHKQEGDTVAVGDILVELETDKVDVEVGAEAAGVLVSIKQQTGVDVQIGDVLGEIEEGQGGREARGERRGESGGAEERGTTESGGAEEQRSGGAGERGVVEREDGERITPVARRLAEEQGVDWAQVKGSGTNDRITKQDIENYLRQQEEAGAAETAVPQDKAASQPRPKAEAAGPEAAGVGREERIRLSRRRRTIAQRLVEAQRTAAMLTTFNDVDMSAIMELRHRRQESFQKQHGVKLGFMSFFVKAAIGALKAFPRLNAEIEGDEMILKHYYDIGMAVGAEEGLVVPVIREADRKSFAQIEQEIRELVQKAGDNSLTLEDLRGGTFTITNGGVFGSLLSTPILNPPQVGILGLHRIEERPVAYQGEVVIRPMMYVALSYDHRLVDGREAVQFLVRLKELIEDPEVLLLEG